MAKRRKKKAKGAPPAFQFYASDWLGSNLRAMLSLEEQAAYVNLLCRQWCDPTCSLPDDDDVLARLSELGQGWLNGGCRLLRRGFPPHPHLEGCLANPKLLELREEYDEFLKKCSKGGQASVASRAAKSTGAETSGESDGAKGGSTTVGTKTQPTGVPKRNTPSPTPTPTPSSAPSPTPTPSPSSSSDAPVLAAQEPCRPRVDRSDEIRAVFDHYRLYHEKAHKVPQSTQKEWGQIRARLKEGYTLDDLKQAIDGIHKSPYHVGGNDRGAEYLSLDLIMRNSSYVVKYMEMDENPPVPKNQAEQKAMAVVARFVERKCSE